MLKALKSGRLKAYTDSYFEETRDFEDILPAIQKRDTTAAGFELLNQGRELTDAYIAERDISAYDIKQYRVKGVWYFDKRRSELRYRILGIAPVAPDVNFIDQQAEDEADAGECEVSNDPPATPPIEAAILGEAKWEDLACTKATCSHNCDPLL